MKKPLRLDVFLVKKGLCDSRSQAQRLIKEGRVQVFSPVTKKFQTLSTPSTLISDMKTPVHIEQHPHLVSRAGYKLWHLIPLLKNHPSSPLQIKEARVLDIGISTGGFTDCLLQQGAKHVVGIDVGHNQLHPSLKENKKVTLFEGVNARYLSTIPELKDQKGSFDLIVIDTSFISIKHILPEALDFLTPKGKIIALIKPQFELGSIALNKKGIVKDEKLSNHFLQNDFKNFILQLGLSPLGFFKSPLRGKKGNQEFFLYAKRQENTSRPSISS